MLSARGLNISEFATNEKPLKIHWVGKMIDCSCDGSSSLVTKLLLETEQAKCDAIIQTVEC